jgi:hypothetical protein
VEGDGRLELMKRRWGAHFIWTVALASALLIGGAVPAAASDGSRVVTGVISFDHADGFDTDRSEEYPMLDTGSDRLRLVGVRPEDVTAGAAVRVVGRLAGSDLVVDRAKRDISAAPALAPAGVSAAGVASTHRTIAVLLINFVDQGWTTTSPQPPQEPWTKQHVRDLYFDGPSSVAAYYSELSDGMLSITGDVFGYYTLNVPPRPCDYTGWGAAARAAAEAAGVDLAAYTNVVHVFTHQPACWWQGIAVVPGTKNWVNGALNHYVATHELGHNLGVAHASSTSCVSGVERVSFSATCTTDEYGDPYDVMGYTGSRQMNGWHRYQLGMMAAADVQTVTDPGEYSLTPVGAPSAEIEAPRMLRVARSAGDYWYLEHRQPGGVFDDFGAHANAVSGLGIRLAPDLTIIRSRLIDTTPWTTSFDDAPLAVGATFVDPIDGWRITLESLDGAGAVVDIQHGPTGAPAPGPASNPAPGDDVTPPSAPGILAATLVLGDEADLAWDAATDDVGVDHYLVSIGGVPHATTHELGLLAVTLAGGYTYELSVSAVAAAGTVGEAAATSLVVPDVTPPQTLAKFVLSRSGGNAVMSWKTPLDNIALAGFRVYRDGQQIATLTPDTVNYVDSGAAPGVRRYAVLGYDAAGNRGVPGFGTLTLPTTNASAPTVPTGLAAVSQPRRYVVLTWNASTDDGGTVKYQVFRGSRKVAVVTATTFTDRPRRPGSYSYRVRAVDAQKNKSAFSDAVIGIAAKNP